MPRSTNDAISILTTVLALAAPAFAQDTNAKNDERPGAQYCTNCHFDVPRGTAGSNDKYWVGEHWAGWQADPHRRASKVLDQPLGKTMEGLLQKYSSDPASWKAGVRSDTRCTSCHGGPTRPNEAPVDGLTCFDCHQDPNGQSGWITLHAFLTPMTSNATANTPPSKTTRWRSRTSDEKRQLGFRPLHDAKVRADTCLSCHVGNPAEGKFVTHEMYAAGHPPLPSIELAKFSEAEYTEKHWLPANHELKKSQGFTDDTSAFQTQLATQGATTALRLQAFLAEEAARSEGAHKHIAWGDYAFYDCASCHHSLAENSWRRKRAEIGPGATGAKVYGRPPPSEWPSALAITLHGDSLRRPLDEFRFAVTDTPFGAAEKVGAAAASLRLALENAQQKDTPTSTLPTLLKNALELGANNDFDFDSARQIAWFVNSLARSMDDSDPIAKAVKRNISGLPFANETRYLPKWSSANKELPDLAAKDRLKGLAEMLKAKHDYHPKVFRQWCKDVLVPNSIPAR